MKRYSKNNRAISLNDAINYISCTSFNGDRVRAYNAFIEAAIDGDIVARGNDGNDLSEYYPIPFDDWHSGDVNADKNCIRPKVGGKNIISHYNIFVSTDDIHRVFFSNELNQNSNYITDKKKRKTGPKTGKTDNIILDMKKDIELGSINIRDLQNMSDIQLESKYGCLHDAKRTTCRNARKIVIGENRN